MEYWLLIPVFLVIYFLFIKKKKAAETQRAAENLIQSYCVPDNNFSSVKGTTVNKMDSGGIEPRQENEEDELATFTLTDWRLTPYTGIESPPEEREPVEYAKNARWVRPGEICQIHHHTITGGHFYVGEQLKQKSRLGFYEDDGNDASLINVTLPVSPASGNYEDESLGYWPRYSALSPACRSGYLSWLASDRSDPASPVGYVFIYFYGLERRILVDGHNGRVNDSEFRALFDEILRLRILLRENNAFKNYSARLIDVMLVIRPQVVSLPETSGFLLTNESLFFRFQLANTVAQALPVPAEMALAWIKYYPLYALQMPARRCEAEFATLFKHRYVELFGAGLIVKPNKTPLKLEYTPASSTLNSVLFDRPDLPDPSILKTPVQKLIHIADTCTGDLEAYSRYLGKKGTSPHDAAAVVLLPDEILSQSAEEMLARFRGWADENINQRNGLASLTEFWTHLGMTPPERINKKETELMQVFVRKAGYGIAPDSRYHDAKPAPLGQVVLFTEPAQALTEPSAEFAKVCLAIRFGAQMAMADSDADALEHGLLQRTIDNNPVLTAAEKRSLQAYLIWRLNSPANVAGLKASTEQLSRREKTEIAEFLISVACADGKIAPAEIRHLEKLYAYLGLESSAVTSDLHRYTLSEKLTSPTTPLNGFSLDESILARHESETKDAHSLLSTIFAENEPPEPREIAVPASEPAAVKLDEAHLQLYQTLKLQDKWDRDDVTQRCHQLGLMLSGAIETINDWSYEQVDAPVIDDDGEIYVDMEIIQELEG